MYHRLDDDIAEDETTYEDSTTWDACQDLDKFLADVYRYHRCNGLSGIVAAEALNCVALLFTVSFSFTLVFLVDWVSLSTCSSGEAKDNKPRCEDVNFFYSTPFEGLQWYHYVALLYFCCFAIFCLVSVWRAIIEIRQAADTRSFYEQKLRIHDVASSSWAEVLDRLSKRQSVAPFCIKQDTLSPLEITNILMRQDNFLIALINHGALFTGAQRWIPKRFLLNKSVIYCLRVIIFSTIFDHHARIVQHVVDHPITLQRKFRFFGSLVLLLIGPVIVFVAIYFFMRHAEDFRSGRSFPFERQWTPYARWVFREYNELPHDLCGRLRRGQQEAKQLLAHAAKRSPLLDAFRRCIKYIAGSLLAVLVVLAIMDDTYMLSVQIHNKTLWWYLAFFGVLVAWSADSDPETTPDVETNYIETVWRTVQHTHYFLRDYDRKEMTRKMFHTLCQDYKDNFLCTRVQMLVEEMLGVILCPFFLLFHFPNTAGAICDVIRSTHYSSKALGDWCRHGNLKVTENDTENVRVQNFGKVPKSLVNFLMTHTDAPESLDVPPESLAFLHEVEKAATEEGPLDMGLIQLTALIERDVETDQLSLCPPNFKSMNQRPRDEIWHPSAPHFYWLDAVISRRYEETFLQENEPSSSTVRPNVSWDVLDGTRRSARFEYFDIDEPRSRSAHSGCVIT